MKKSKVISIILIIFIFLLCFNDIVCAMDVIEHPGSYKPTDLGDEKELNQKVSIILGVINVIGVVMSVITLMVIGIKYMLGSIEEKAEYKKTMGLYLLGAFLAISITTLPNILYKMSSNI